MFKVYRNILRPAIIALAIAILGLQGCGTSRKVGSNEATALPGSHFDATAAYDVLVGNYVDWHDVELPVKIELQQPARFSASGKAIMVNGEAISVSLRKLGFEIARIYISDTDIILVSKPLRIAYVESTELFTHYTGLKVADIQNVLLGRIFIPGSSAATTLTRKQFNITPLESGDSWTISPKRSARPLFFTATECDAPDGNADVVLESIAVEGAGNLTINFKNTSHTSYGPVPEMLEVGASYRNRTLGAAWKWTPGHAKWNNNTTIAAPEIPDGYRRLDTPALLNMLKKL